MNLPDYAQKFGQLLECPCLMALEIPRTEFQVSWAKGAPQEIHGLSGCHRAVSTFTLHFSIDVIIWVTAWK